VSPRPGSHVAARLAEVVRARLSAAPARPVVLGLCGAQGSGKSTVALRLEESLADSGVSAARLSIDDLYLSRRDRAGLAQTYPLAATRGPPGTHDISLGLETLDRLGQVGETALPRFDKAADDRLPAEIWPVVKTPVEVVILEGWCVGATPEAAKALERPINDLERNEDPDGRWRHWVNDQLAGSYQRLFARIDVLALLAAPSFAVVPRWRGEQEAALQRRLKARGEDASGCLDRASLARFVAHYERLTRHILTEMPSRADVTIRLDTQRRPVGVSLLEPALP